MNGAPSPGPLASAARTVALLLSLGTAGVAEAQVGLGISRNADLNFGQIVAGLSAGDVTVGPLGGRSATGGVTLGGGLSVSAAAFTVTGEPSTAYGIVLPGSITLAGGSHSVTVDSFASDPDGSGLLGGEGTQTLGVGATLHVAANQAGGSYAGSFSVTVAYN